MGAPVIDWASPYIRVVSGGTEMFAKNRARQSHGSVTTNDEEPCVCAVYGRRLDTLSQTPRVEIQAVGADTETPPLVLEVTRTTPTRLCFNRPLAVSVPSPRVVTVSACWGTWCTSGVGSMLLPALPPSALHHVINASAPP